MSATGTFQPSVRHLVRSAVVAEPDSCEVYLARRVSTKPRHHQTVKPQAQGKERPCTASIQRMDFTQLSLQRNEVAPLRLGDVERLEAAGADALLDRGYRDEADLLLGDLQHLAGGGVGESLGDALDHQLVAGLHARILAGVDVELGAVV